MILDTLSIARDLRAADLPLQQAEAIAAAIGRSVAETSATKGDLEQVRTELRAEIEQLRTELRAEIEQVRTELKTEIERAKNQLILWVISGQIALAGIVIAVIKL